MIEELCIENVALIEKQRLCFGPGLNVLSGETGAGKTMVIDSINFLLGERSNRDFIRSSADMAVVSGLVRLGAGHEDIETDEDGALHIHRTINTQGKSACRINGRTVTLGMLREASAQLADVHGQHAHQSLLDPARHIVLLDRFCGAPLAEHKSRLGGHIRRYKELTRGMNELSGGKDREARLDILRFQADEIAGAALKPDEEETLTQRHALLSAAEKLAENAAAALNALCDGERAAVDQVARAMKAAAEIARVDADRQGLADALGDAYSLLDDLSRDLRKYSGGLEHDPSAIAEVETRLDLIHSLKRKYGGTLDAVIAFGDDAARQIALIETGEERLRQLTAQRRTCTNEILSTCDEMSSLRKAAALSITRAIEGELHELGMRHAAFQIAVERKKEFSANGYDRVEFMIAPNPGEGMKPLAKIASGGEMSRVMLAIKTVLADADQIETFIFDEIDAGVSGRTAQKVAEKLALLARRRQILCITHLPQIAAMADRHFLIEKRSDSARTETSVRELDAPAAVAELARLLGGVKITDATYKAAEEMRALAAQIKTRK